MVRNLGRRRVLVGAAAGLAPQGACAAGRLVRIGHSSTPASPSGRATHAFASAVAAHPLLQAVLRVQVHDNGALGEELDAMAGCMDGTIDLAVCTVGVVSTALPELGLLDTPFLFRDAPAARAVLDGAIGAAFASALQARGVNLVAWVENGLRHMTANRPVRRPADLAGLKMRVPPSEVELAGFRALGADPSPLPFAALYEALRTGEFEAQETPIALIEALRLFEVQKVLSLTTHIYGASVMLAAQDLLDDLGPAQQAALAACARAGAAASRAAAETAQRDGVARLRAAGMEVVEDVDRPAFLAAARPNFTAMGLKYGAARMDSLVRAGA